MKFKCPICNNENFNDMDGFKEDIYWSNDHCYAQVFCNKCGNQLGTFEIIYKKVKNGIGMIKSSDLKVLG